MGAAAATPDTLARLLELLRDPSEDVRVRAASALGQMGAAAATPDTLARLLELLRDPSEDVRVRAASALGQMGARAVDEHTVKMLAEFWSGLLEDVTSRTFPEGFMRVCDKAYKELQKLASRQGATGAAE
jgi:HEAT repeat protein